MPARLLSKRNVIPRIYVLINRNLQQPRTAVLVDERRTPSWHAFLDHLTVQLDDSTLGVVQSLVEVPANREVHSFKELKNNAVYVACGQRRFVPLNYTTVTDYKERAAAEPPVYMPKEASRRLSKKLGKKTLRPYLPLQACPAHVHRKQAPHGQGHGIDLQG